MFAVPERQTNRQTNCFHKLNSLSMQNVQPVSLVVFTNLSLVQLMWLFKKKQQHTFIEEVGTTELWIASKQLTNLNDDLMTIHTHVLMYMSSEHRFEYICITGI